MKNYSNFKTQLNHHLPQQKLIFDQFFISRSHKTPKRTILGQFLFHGSQILCRRFQTIKTNHRVSIFQRKKAADWPAQQKHMKVIQRSKSFRNSNK